MIEIRITPFRTVYMKNCNNFSVKRENKTTTIIVKHEEIDYDSESYEDFDLVGLSNCYVIQDKCEQEVFVNDFCPFHFEQKEGETHFIFGNSYVEYKKQRSITKPVKTNDDLSDSDVDSENK